MKCVLNCVHMAFVKGQPKVPGSGRPKGSKTKAVLETIRETLARREINLVDYLFDEVLPHLEPKDQAKTIVALCEYTDAKQRLVEHSGNVTGGTTTINLVLPGPKEQPKQVQAAVIPTLPSSTNKPE